MGKPLDLFHDLEGGQIAAQRPPPPGAGQPYPHVGLVPAKPVMTDLAYRRALQNELSAERDQKELMAADLPRETMPPPPPARPTPAAAPPPAAGGPAAGPPPAEDSSANATIPAADSPPVTAKALSTVPPPPPQDAALQIVGDPVDTPGLPLVPDGPPPPASFEGVPAQPEPTPRMLPAHLSAPVGTAVFFAPGSATLPPSQTQTLRDLASHRRKQTILITGEGEAESDTPGGQETAIDLALHRARSVADALAAMHVPQSAMRVAARPFGRDAVITLLP